MTSTLSSLALLFPLSLSAGRSVGILPGILDGRLPPVAGRGRSGGGVGISSVMKIRRREGPGVGAGVVLERTETTGGRGGGLRNLFGVVVTLRAVVPFRRGTGGGAGDASMHSISASVSFPLARWLAVLFLFSLAVLALLSLARGRLARRSGSLLAKSLSSSLSTYALFSCALRRGTATYALSCGSRRPRDDSEVAGRKDARRPDGWRGGGETKSAGVA